MSAAAAAEFMATSKTWIEASPGHYTCFGHSTGGLAEIPDHTPGGGSVHEETLRQAAYLLVIAGQEREQIIKSIAEQRRGNPREARLAARKAGEAEAGAAERGLRARRASAAAAATKQGVVKNVKKKPAPRARKQATRPRREVEPTRAALNEEPTQGGEAMDISNHEVLPGEAGEGQEHLAPGSPPHQEEQPPGQHAGQPTAQTTEQLRAQPAQQSSEQPREARPEGNTQGEDSVARNKETAWDIAADVTREPKSTIDTHTQYIGGQREARRTHGNIKPPLGVGDMRIEQHVRDSRAVGLPVKRHEDKESNGLYAARSCVGGGGRNPPGPLREDSSQAHRAPRRPEGKGIPQVHRGMAPGEHTALRHAFSPDASPHETRWIGGKTS
jgi:hypothetical protein